jgi:hypothetical protein
LDKSVVAFVRMKSVVGSRLLHSIRIALLRQIISYNLVQNYQ